MSLSYVINPVKVRSKSTVCTRVCVVSVVACGILLGSVNNVMCPNNEGIVHCKLEYTIQ